MGEADEDWNLMGTLNYSLTQQIQLSAGYRHLSVDYQRDGFVYDVEMSGPLLGIAGHF